MYIATDLVHIDDTCHTSSKFQTVRGEIGNEKGGGKRTILLQFFKELGTSIDKNNMIVILCIIIT